MNAAERAEQAIRAKLDGTFTKVTRIGNQVVTEVVPLDYIPDHTPFIVSENVGRRSADSPPRHYWTPEEDVELQRLRRMGWPKRRCALHFNCSEDAVRRRLEVLRPSLQLQRRRRAPAP